MRLFILILLFSVSAFAGKVAVISKTRANNLTGKDVTDDLRFNPVWDSLGRWCISKEEIDQLTDSNYLYLKSLPLIEYIAPKSTFLK